MMRRVFFFGVFLVSAALWTCGPSGTPTLSLKAIETADGARIEISATNGDGTVGKGVVNLTANSGTLDKSSVTLDEFGTGIATLDCNPVTDTACLTARVTASWTPQGAKEPIEETVRLSFPMGTGAGAGGGGGTGGVEFDGGLRLIDKECGTRVPEINPTCCRTNQEFGKQQPACPAYQMKPGGTFDLAFDGYSSALSTTPFATNVPYDLTFNGPTSISSLAQCSDLSTATLTARFNSDNVEVGGTVVHGRLTSLLWVGVYAGGGGVVPPMEVCTMSGTYPNRIAYYVTMTRLTFTATDGTIWKQVGNQTFFYTVALGFQSP